MTKNKLISLLQNIKGNPEIKLWNGMVGDWMDIKLVESELVKESEEFVRWRFEASWRQDNKTEIIPSDVQKMLDEEIKEAYKEREWEFPNPYVSRDDENMWYDKNRKKSSLSTARKKGNLVMTVWERFPIKFLTCSEF